MVRDESRGFIEDRKGGVRDDCSVMAGWCETVVSGGCCL